MRSASLLGNPGQALFLQLRQMHPVSTSCLWQGCGWGGEHQVFPWGRCHMCTGVKTPCGSVPFRTVHTLVQPGSRGCVLAKCPPSCQGCTGRPRGHGCLGLRAHQCGKYRPNCKLRFRRVNGLHESQASVCNVYYLFF